MKDKRFSFQSVLLAVCLAVSGSGDVFAKRKDPHVQRIYELVLTVVSLQGEPVFNARQSEKEFPHRLVTVHATVTNVAKQFPCTELQPFLEVKPYYLYHLEWDQTSYGFRELLPGQTMEVDYRFSTRESTTPVALLLRARQTDPERCRRHPDWGSIWHAREEVRVPVDDLPEKSAQK
jgi:hypothetical protein